MKKTELIRKTPLKSTGALKRTTALVSSPKARSHLHAESAERRLQPKRRTANPPRDTSPSAKVVALVFQRDEGRCFRCGLPVRFADRGVGWSTQHRRAKGMGGSRRPDTNQPQNLIVLCGSATSPNGCHLRVESRLPADDGMGWSIKQGQDPLRMPVAHWRDGLVWLTDSGAALTAPPTTAEEATA